MNTPRVVVLLEGESDVAALRVLARVRGLLGQAELVDMGGVTNVRRLLADLVATQPASRVLGLCDARESRVVARALAAYGFDAASRTPMSTWGFHVCDADLEDELIRALGTGSVLGVLRDLGLANRFETFRQQPAWNARPLPAQLRRFAGVASGRKALLGAALASALQASQIPRPLAELLTQVELAVADDGDGIAVRAFLSPDSWPSAPSAGDHAGESVPPRSRETARPSAQRGAVGNS